MVYHIDQMITGNLEENKWLKSHLFFNMDITVKWSMLYNSLLVYENTIKVRVNTLGFKPGAVKLFLILTPRLN